MFDANEIAQLRGILHEVLQQNNTDLKREMRDEVYSLISASEKRIVSEIGELFDASVLPQIAELQSDMTKVKQHLQLA